MKRQWEAKIGELTGEIIKQLAGLSKKDIPAKDPEAMKVYKTLVDTFNAFDNDGSAELGFSEYKDAWKFLGRPGSDDEIAKAFNSVDVGIF